MTSKHTKECRMCKSIKSVDDFYNMASQNDGKHYYCKECCKIKRGAERVRKRDRTSKVSHRQQNRARSMGLEVESITLAKLYERDNGICGICGKRVNTRYASIDHIQPVSKGGHHIWTNVQLTHIRCNKIKSNKVTPK